VLVRQLARLGRGRDDEQQIAPPRFAVEERKQLFLCGFADLLELADEHRAALGHELTRRRAAGVAELRAREPHERTGSPREDVQQDRELLLADSLFAR